MNVRKHVAAVFNWATGKTARENEHRRNQYIQQLAQNISHLQENPGLVAEAKKEYTVRAALGKPLFGLYGDFGNDKKARPVIMGALDVVTEIDPELAADFMSSVTNYGHGKSLLKPVCEKLMALTDRLPAEEALSALGTIAIYVEDLRDQVGEKYVAQAKRLPRDEAFTKLLHFAGNGYASASKIIPAVLDMAAQDGMTAKQKTAAYRAAATHGGYDPAVQARGIADWSSSVTTNLTVDEGIEEAKNLLQRWNSKNAAHKDPLGLAAVKALGQLAPGAKDPDTRFWAAQKVVEHAAPESPEWRQSLSTCVDALDQMQTYRALDLVNWFARAAEKDEAIQDALAVKLGALAARTPAAKLLPALTAVIVNADDYVRRTPGKAEVALMNTWLHLQADLPAEEAYTNARLMVEHGRPDYRYGVMREKLKTEGVPYLFVTIADRLAPDKAVEAASYASTLAEGTPLAEGAAAKWAQVARGLEPAQRLKEIYRIQNFGEKGDPLRRQALRLERETCKDMACGMTPDAFVSRFGQQPGPRV